MKVKNEYLKNIGIFTFEFQLMTSLQYKFRVSLVLWNHNNGEHLAMVQKTISDTLHKECKSQRVITERGGWSRSAVSKHIKCKVDWKEEIG